MDEVKPSDANGHSNGSSRANNTGDPNRWPKTMRDEMRDITQNWGAIRSQFFRNFFTGPDETDFNRQCKYPDTAELRNPWWFRELFEREPVAARVVQLMPKECWKVQPLVYESDDPDDETEFERAWDQLGQSLRGEACWYSDEKGSPVWEYCKRADILSRIGRFGVMLLGIDDGRNLDQPADGVMSVNPTTNRVWPSKPRATPSPDSPESEVLNVRECDGSPEHGIPAQPHSGELFGGREPSQPMVPVVNSEGRVKFVTQRKAELLVNARRMAVSQVTDEKGEVVYNRRERRADDGGLEFVANVWADHLRPSLDDDITTNAPEQRGFGPNQGRHEPDWTTARTRAGEPLWPTSFAGAEGTDAQYVGVQLSAPEFPSPEVSEERRKLLFIRCFDEALVQVVQYEADVRNPRFGAPVMYRITLNDPSTQSSGIGLPLATVRVHWSRVVHLPGANRVSSEIFSIPEMQQVLNPILDVRKIRGAGAEGYWRTCFTRFSLETHPQLGGDVSIDEEGTRQKLRDMVDDLEPGLIMMGMSAKTLTPSVVDPTPHIAINIESICIQKGCPIRIFKGAERGEMASSQDDDNWNDRCREQNISYTNPVVVVGLIDRLISLGVLPEPKAKHKDKNRGLLTGAKPPQPAEGEEAGAGKPPFGGGKPFGGPPTGNSWRRVKRGPDRIYRVVRNAAGKIEVKDPEEELRPGDKTIGKKVIKGPENDIYDSPAGYSVEWPDLSALGPKDKAAIALSITQTLAAYVQGNVEALIPPRDFLSEVVGPTYGWDEEKVGQILADARDAQETMTMPPPGDLGHPASEAPETPPTILEPGQSVMGEDGQPGDKAAPGKIPTPIQQHFHGPKDPNEAAGEAGGGEPGAVAEMHAAKKAKPVQNARTLSGGFHRPENYDKIADLGHGRQLWAGANDWESGWTSAWITTDQAAHGEPLAWIDVDHSQCRGCGGDPGNEHPEDEEACLRFSKQQVMKWANSPTQNTKDRRVAPSAPSWAGSRGYGSSAPGSEGEEVPRQSTSREDADEDDIGSTFSTDLPVREPIQNLDEATKIDYRQDKPEEDDRLQRPDAVLSSETGVPRSTPTPQPSEDQRQHTLGDGNHPEEIGHGSQAGIGALNANPNHDEQGRFAAAESAIISDASSRSPLKPSLTITEAMEKTGLNVKEIHGLLTKMHGEGKIALNPYTQAVGLHPHPEHLLPLHGDKKFYIRGTNNQVGLIQNTSSGSKEEWTTLDTGSHGTSTTVDIADLRERAAELRASGLGQPDYGQLYVRGAEVWWVGGDSDERGFGELVEEELAKVVGVSSVHYSPGEQYPKGEDWVRVWPNGNPNLDK